MLKLTTASLQVFFTLFFLLSILNFSLSQSVKCGVSNNLSLKKYENNIYKNATSNPKVVFTVVRESDGSGGANKDYVLEELIPEVINFYASYDIEINYCFREVHNSNLYNDRNFYPILCDDDYNSSYYFNIYSTPDGEILGLAPGVDVCCGWGIDEVDVVAHELGHMFGLAHTHHMCGDSELAEPVHHHIDDPLNCSGKHCDETGDRCCDTPADRSGFLIINLDDGTIYGCSNKAYNDLADCESESTGILDICGVEYSDPEHIIRNNVMSYISTSECQEFTPDQVTRMEMAIESSGRTGSFSDCDMNEVLKFGTTFTNEAMMIEGQELYFDNYLNLTNSNILFINCTLWIESGINIDNSSLIFNNSSVNINFCNPTLPSQVFLRNGSSLIIGNESKVIGPLVTVQKVDNLHGLFWVKDSEVQLDLNFNENSRIMFVSDVDYTGSINCSGPNSSINITESTLSSGDANQDIFQNIMNVDVFFNKVVMSDSKSAGSFSQSNLYIDDSYFHSMNSFAFNTSSTDIDIRHSYFDQLSVKIDQLQGIQILNNSFSGCNVDCDPQITIYGTNDLDNYISNNKLEFSKKGIEAWAVAEGLLMLCNEFVGMDDEYNFLFGNLNPVQSPDLLNPSGNVFSNMMVNKISGNSSPTLYYHSKNTNEVLVNHTNLGVSPLEVSDPYLNFNCGLIGPKYTIENILNGDFVDEDNDNNPPNSPGPNAPGPPPPSVIVTGCPVGINCKMECPTGINCDEPCPVGINCFEPCPTGINCDEPCPPGINCYQPCPPGINCSEPCPPGINCNEPCPPGINCNEPCHPEVGCDYLFNVEIDDPVLPYLNQLYYVLDNVIIDLQPQQENWLDIILDGSSASIRNNITNAVIEEGQYLTVLDFVKIISMSDLFYEEEVVDMLHLNPHLLFDSNIRKRVFISNSFEESNNKLLTNVMSSFLNSEDSREFKLIERTKLDKSNLIRYALKRIQHGDSQLAPDLEILWKLRYDEHSSDLDIVRKLILSEKFTYAENLLSNMLNSQILHDFEKIEISGLREINYLLWNNNKNEKQIKDLDDTRIEKLKSLAKDKRYSTSSFAKTILANYFSISISQDGFYPTFMPLKFLNKSEAYNSFNFSKNAELKKIRIMPNPNNGSFKIGVVSESWLKARVYNCIGDIQHEVLLTKGTNEFDLKLNPGVYYAHIFGSDGESVLKKFVVF